MFPETIPQASSCLSYVDLVAGTTLDNVYHVPAYTGVPRSDGNASPRRVDRRGSIGVGASVAS